MLGDKRLIRTIRLRNLLSFGPESEEVELLGLNVLIGPNGCGKSNLIHAIDLLRACPRDLTKPFWEGGVAEWLWKGGGQPPVAEIDATVSYASGPMPMPLRHRLIFGGVGQRFGLVDEVVESKLLNAWNGTGVFYRYKQGNPVVRGADGAERALRREDFAANQSVLSQLKDPVAYPEITYLGREYPGIRLYRQWDTAELRRPQKTDLPAEFLAEDASNLAIVLNSLQKQPENWRAIVEKLGQFHEPFEGIYTEVYGGTIQLSLFEHGLNQPISATRLSDGTLRYLCLLAILCHPELPPLVCIEEPEIGLHPDILPAVAKLLVEASQRMQLIVTTHSDALVDALTDTPEAVVVCEKHEGSTTMRRLESAALEKWLKDYSLGQLWRDGEIGGNRW
jgi:predicted ATPase